MSRDDQPPSDPIPEFATREEIAEFWDTHDFADYWDELKPANVTVSADLESVFRMPLDDEALT